MINNHSLVSEDDYYSDLDSAKLFNSPPATTLSSYMSNPADTPSPCIADMPDAATRIAYNDENDESSEESKSQQLLKSLIDINNNRKSHQQATESSEESEIEMNIKIEIRLAATTNTKKPEVKSPFVKRTAIIEVRPEYSTAAMISLNSPPMSASPSSSSASSVIDETEIFKKQQHNHQPPDVSVSLVRRDSATATATHPVFPALGENELNEQHVNFMVKRTGDIIEKNGVYFSHDGSVRGYPGVVRKFAQSSSLKEIFNKQQELERQQETLVEDQERQLMLEKKLNVEKFERIQQAAAQNNKVKNTFTTTTTPTKTRTVQVAATPPQPADTTSKSSGKNFTSIRKYTSDAQLSSSGKTSLDDELSRKLQTRRQLIQSQLDSAENNQNPTNNTTTPSINKLNSSFNSSVTIIPNKPSEVVVENKKAQKQLFQLKPSQSEMIIVNKSAAENNINNSNSNKLSIDVAPPLSIAPTPPKPLAAKLPAVSFVMSAKSKDSNVYNNRNSLLSELKAVVPMIGAVDEENPREQMSSPPLPPPPPMSQFEIQEASSSSLVITPPPPPPLPPMPFSMDSPKTYLSNMNCFKLKQTDLKGQQPYKSPATTTFKPVVAPKNFSENARKSLGNRNQVVDTRVSLLESIKSFQFSSLKRASNLV